MLGCGDDDQNVVAGRSVNAVEIAGSLRVSSTIDASSFSDGRRQSVKPSTVDASQAASAPVQVAAGSVACC